MFDNKYVKKSDVSKNPIYNISSIAVEAKNGKVPKIESFQELLTNSNDFIQNRVEKIRDDPQYWIQQGVRTGFFISAGLQAARKTKTDLFNLEADGSSDEKIDGQKKKIEEYVQTLSDYEALYDMEAKNIKDGYYRKPFTTEIGHREINPAWARMKAKDFFRSAKMTSTSKDGSKDDIFISGMYPKYYTESQHFESGQWLNSKNAASYEFAMETLNTGARDTIQRFTMTTLYFWLKDNKKYMDEMRVLEVGGGTGRFMTFFRDNYPQMHTTLLDLNPFFLQEAGKNDRYFRTFFKRQDSRAKNDKIEPSELKLVQGKAEDMVEFENDSFDILNCINLFTSLPSE